MLRSNNPRIEEIFGKYPYKNVEYTLPCAVEALAEFDPENEQEKQVLEAVRSNLRFIVDIDDPEKICPETADQLKILASPMECGRLLEADQEQLIEGEPHTIVMKGIGATRYGVKRGVEKALAKSIDIDDPETLDFYRNSLRSNRFNSRDMGLLHFGNGVREINRTIEFKELGARVQKCLALYRIEALRDSEGKSHSIEELKQRGLIDNGIMPAILVRAMRTNFRVLDLLNLKLLEEKEIFERLLKFVAGRYPDVRTYFFKFIEEFLRSEMMLLTKGYQVDNPDWDAHARNISLEAEEIDLEDVGQPKRSVIEIRPSWANVLRLFVMMLGPEIKNFNAEEIEKFVTERIEEEILKSGLDQTEKQLWTVFFTAHWDKSKIRMPWEIKHGYQFIKALDY